LGEAKHGVETAKRAAQPAASTTPSATKPSISLSL
jgi:hypothetical protein